jgi:Tol biopolymer transport system component
MDDWAICFSPQGEELYFTVTGKDQATIACMTFEGGRWSGPEVVAFSGRYFDYAPVISPDGKRLIFCSQRPTSPDSGVTDTNLWMSYRRGDGWSEPAMLPAGVNTEGTNDVWPSLAANGDLYFSSNREGGEGGFDLYLSKFVDGEYQQPENLGSPLNTELGEYCPFIAPDDSYLIFEIVDAPGGLGGGDMYISVKQPDGSWGEPVNMGEIFNPRRHDCYPHLSPDGKYLFFMSDRRSRTPRQSETKLAYGEIEEHARRSGGWDIYWIDATVLDQFLVPAESR